MNKLTLNDVIQFLYFLLFTRRTEVNAIADVAGGANVLDRTYVKLAALPPELGGGATNAEALESGDSLHDGFGLALWYLAHAYLAAPNATPQARAGAQYILANFITERRELNDSFATEAGRAATRQPKLVEGRTQLDALPVEGGTAHLWATAYIDAGMSLAPLLQGRADAKGARTPAGALRAQAIGQIGRFRAAIHDALIDTPDQGHAVDKRLFAYLDLLAELRNRGSNEPTPPPVDVAPPAA